MNVLRSPGASSHPRPSEEWALRAQRARRARDLEVHTVSAPEAIARLTPEWQALHELREDAHPFQRPEWSLAWMHTFVIPRMGGDGRAPSAGSGLRVVTVRWDGRLVGLLPLLAYQDEALAPSGRRRLVFLGDGLSDYLDAEIEPDLAAEVGQSLIEAIEGSSDWQTCRLRQLPANSTLVPVLSELVDAVASVPSSRRDASPSSWRAPASYRPIACRLHYDDPCPIVDVSSGLEAVVPGHQLARFRKAARRAQRNGAVALRVITEASEVAAAWDSILQLHLARWTTHEPSTSPTSMSDPDVVAFQRRAVVDLARAGAVRLYLLCFGERVVAGLYAMTERQTLYCYLQGFDPELSAASPGTLIVGYVLQDAVQQGFRVVDFLRGEEDYKYLWGARNRDTYQFEATR